MQQLLSLNGQSDLFTRGASELTLSSEGTGNTSNASDFARALLTGLKQSKATEVGATTAVSTQETPTANASKSVDLEHERVGEPVEAPILEMLEEMQNLLQPGDDSDGAAFGNQDVDAEQLAELTQVLNKLGTEHLSDEQRQQLAGEILAGLSPKEKQLLSEFDVEALTHSAANGAGSFAPGKSTDVQTGTTKQPAQLLLKIAKIADLADQAVAAAHMNVAELTSATKGDDGQIDVKALEWLAQQLNNLKTQGTEKAKTVTDSEQETAALMQQLQRQIADADSLSTEQKQQLRQWLADQQATLQQEFTRPSLLAAIMKDTVQNTPDVATSQPTPEKISIPLDRRGEVRTAEVTETPRQVVPNPATAERSNDKGAPLAAEAQSTSRAVNADTAELKLPFNSADGLNVTGNKADMTQLAAALENAATLKPAAALDAGNGLGETTLNPSVSHVSTTTGAVKATELSSTLQSAMQAIQKPFDPSQAEASQKLQERINIMLSKNIQRADIRLDPPELGQLHVRVNMNSDQASVHFHVQSSQARDAVETALPRLREMLEQQGVALADTDVQEQQQQLAGNNEWSEAESQSGRGQAGEFVEEHEISLSNGRPIAAGAVDFYV